MTDREKTAHQAGFAVGSGADTGDWARFGRSLRRASERDAYARGRAVGWASVANRDLCPICGEDRAHASQHGAHRC